MRRAWLLLVLLGAGGCVYYNGMYNAKRLANRARKAEAENRTFEATSLWGQVGVKAESVLAQHPRSKYADEARLLQGTSLARLRNCAGALRPLEIVAVTSTNATFREEATALLGDCRTQLGDAKGAMEAYSSLRESKDPARRRLALFAHGRAQRMEGHYAEALEELAGTSQPGAAGERAAALAGLGRLPEANAVADSLLAARDTLVPWDAIVSLTAGHDRDAAARLTDRLVADTILPLAQRARLLVADAERWRPTDVARSDARITQMEQLAAGNPQAGAARLEGLRLQLQEIDAIPALRAWIERVEALSEGTGQVAPEALRLAATATRVVLTADSVDAGSPAGDLRLFLAGELARDSLEAARLAAVQFGRVVREWPGSPFAPKAVLALIVLEPAGADSLQGVLQARYGGSPYVALIQTGASAEYEALEDSLRRFAGSFRPEARRLAPPAPIQRQDRPAAAPREPVN
ncbi:MAG TPA: hypothetical protein VG692_10875 [Gemmatimonadales bacterium]|nr:hypothetical protein [Gemmatimonadales bacterium]